MLCDWLHVYKIMALTMLSPIMSEMEQEGLSQTQEYKQLKKSESDIQSIEIDPSFDNLKSTTLSIIDIYVNLLRGNSIMLRNTMKKVFAKYMQEQ
jgi:hypothetical protein